MDKKFEVALRLIAARETGKEIAKALRSPQIIHQVIPQPVTEQATPPFPSLMKFSNPDNGRVNVAAGAQRTKIFELAINRGSEIGVITRVANDFFPGDDLLWYVDGAPIEDNPIHRKLGIYPDNPSRVVIPFYDRTTWYYTNRDSSTHPIGILCDGVRAPLKDEQILMNIVSNGGL